MRVTHIAVAAAFAIACKKGPVAFAEPNPVAPLAARTDVIRGAIVERIDAGQYTYLKLRTAAGDVWTAVPGTEKRVGDTAGVLSPIWMEHFKSSTLGRTWDRIAFGTLEGVSSPRSPPAATAAGEAPATASLPPGHPPLTAWQAQAPVADPGPLHVAKAPGPRGRTIADIHASKAQLEGANVAVRGKVVKATNGVLGKNWLHLRDGTGKEATADLVVAGGQTAPVGETVLVSGTLHLDRDLGAGYRYDVLLEDARIEAE